ncbi:MAG: phosphatase PAP2 family protein [Cellvibrionales bacterium]|nr:phosphatase PAP2 family protein [Cellvibrionales bacterium]
MAIQLVRRNQPLIWLIPLFFIAIFISYFYLDRTIVYFFNGIDTRQYRLLTIAAEGVPALAVTFIVIMLLVHFYRYFCHSKSLLSPWIHIAIICCISNYIKSLLKKLFGRYFPDTWFCDNLSLLENDMYGFAGAYKLTNSSMPSGHLTLATAFLLGLLFFFPSRWMRGVAIAGILLTFLGQLSLYYHFLSDLLAGLLLGLTVVTIYTEFLTRIKNSSANPAS